MQHLSNTYPFTNCAPPINLQTDSWADAIVLFGDFNWAAAPGEGTQYCSWDTPTDPPACAAHNYETGLIYQSKQAGVEVYPSIGGWTLSDPFPAMAANEAARNKFAQQCVELIKSYDFGMSIA